MSAWAVDSSNESVDGPLLLVSIIQGMGQLLWLRTLVVSLT